MENSIDFQNEALNLKRDMSNMSEKIQTATERVELEKGTIINNKLKVNATASSSRKDDGLAMKERPRKGGKPAGLVNQQATCYLNSLLQVLFMTPHFRDALHDSTGTSTACRENLTWEMKQLFRTMQDGNGPYHTKGITSYLDTEISQQCDIQEAWHEILDKIQLDLEGTDQADLITDFYRGRMKDYIQCLKCGTGEEKVVGFLQIPLVVKPYHQNAYMSLEESLDAFTSPQILSGINQSHCDKCLRKQDTMKGLVFIDFPPILTFQLMRFEIDYHTMKRVKVNNRFEFPEKFNLQRYATGKKADDVEASYCYELFAVLLHRGSSAHDHYFADIKSVDDQRWYRFNGEQVRAIEGGVSKEAFGGDIRFNECSAYILMYCRIAFREGKAPYFRVKKSECTGVAATSEVRQEQARGGTEKYAGPDVGQGRKWEDRQHVVNDATSGEGKGKVGEKNHGEGSETKTSITSERADNKTQRTEIHATPEVEPTIVTETRADTVGIVEEEKTVFATVSDRGPGENEATGDARPDAGQEWKERTIGGMEIKAGSKWSRWQDIERNRKQESACEQHSKEQRRGSIKAYQDRQRHIRRQQQYQPNQLPRPHSLGITTPEYTRSSVVMGFAVVPESRVTTSIPGIATGTPHIGVTTKVPPAYDHAHF